MLRSDRNTRQLAVGLAFVAGYVDAIGFLKLGGLFVSFMSGNSTRLAVGFAQHSSIAIVAAALVAGFVAGVVAGSLVAHIARRRREPVVIAFVALLLALAALVDRTSVRGLTPAAMVIAMGAVNTVFQRDGEVSVGVTYMTGTLVKLGQRVAAALLGGDRRAWLPFFLLWLALVLGAVCGALLHPLLGAGALWLVAGTTAAIAIFAYKRADAPSSSLIETPEP